MSWLLLSRASVIPKRKGSLGSYQVVFQKVIVQFLAVVTRQHDTGEFEITSDHKAVNCELYGQIK